MAGSASNLTLSYTDAASEWANALPIGNGRLGSMIYGQVESERWQLNEDSLWYGAARDRNAPDALENLSRLRGLLDLGKIAEAEDLASLAFCGRPESQRHYESLGYVNLTFPHREDQASRYRRELDLRTAVANISYIHEDVKFSREIFASHPDQVIAAEVKSSVPGTVSFRLRIARQSGLPIKYRPQNLEEKIAVADDGHYADAITSSKDCLVMTGQAGGGGVRFCLVAGVAVAGGNVELIGDTICVTKADRAHIYLAGETTFREDQPQAACLRRIEKARSKAYDSLRDRHQKDYQSLFSRVSFTLGAPVPDSSHDISTKEQVESARKGLLDQSLIPLYYQFGRYLLISSSRPGYRTLPANLQGIWNDKISPIWGSRFTININLQMNYWPTEVCNLTECYDPFFELLSRLEKNGRVTAATMYGCKGWMAHHMTDIWADTAPQGRNMKATVWPMGGAWLCTHIWDRYEFSGDLSFLGAFYPILRGCVEFFLDFMVDRDGYKVTSPSSSPENVFRLPNGEAGSLCYSPSMDNQILNQLFSDFLAAADVLGKKEDEGEAAFCRVVGEYRSLLPPIRVGRHGQLSEWLEDYEEKEPGHRHVSHLWGLFPGTQIKSQDQELRDACKVTLARRTAAGGGHTGWSRAWMIALYAHLEDGDAAAHHLAEILRTSTYESLLDDHPPFQIDGNFGSTAAITEMLIQSKGGVIFLHPALPTLWAEGSLSGIRTRGGFEVNLTWRAGVLTECTIQSIRGGSCRLKARQDFAVYQEDTLLERSTGPLAVVQFQTLSRKDYRIVF